MLYENEQGHYDPYADDSDIELADGTVTTWAEVTKDMPDPF